MSQDRFSRLVEIQLECSHKMIVKGVEDHFVPRNELFRFALRTKNKLQDVAFTKLLPTSKSCHPGCYQSLVTIIKKFSIRSEYKALEFKYSMAQENINRLEKEFKIIKEAQAGLKRVFFSNATVLYFLSD